MLPEALSQLASELLDEMPWSVVLPAGCGKTELIAAMASLNPSDAKPILVLTHTNAGVDVIRKRFDKYGVIPRQARVLTLDTWAKHFNDHFPLLGEKSGVTNNPEDWQVVRKRADSVLASRHIGDIIAATYSKVLVDEYQDCSPTQHVMIERMSNYLPVGVLGDPLQGIFDFGEGVVAWADVEASFPAKTVPITPHRWSVKNPELGEWLLSIRPNLVAGGVIDLSNVGSFMQWRRSTADLSAEIGQCFQSHRDSIETEFVVTLLPQANQGHHLARRLAGTYNVAEEIQCKVLEPLMRGLDESNGAIVASETIKLVKACYTGCPSALDARLIQDYARGNPRAYRSNNSFAEIYDSLNNLILDPTPIKTKAAFKLIESRCGQLFRREAWFTAMAVFRDLELSNSGSAISALREIRNRGRFGNRYISRRSVSRTLLVKGQEYDRCIIVAAHNMSARNLYVALSRGIENVIIFSEQPQITILDY